MIKRLRAALDALLQRKVGCRLALLAVEMRQGMDVHVESLKYWHLRGWRAGVLARLCPRPMPSLCCCISATLLTHVPCLCPAVLCGLQVRQPGLRLEEAGGQLMGSLVELLDGEEAALRWQ